MKMKTIRLIGLIGLMGAGHALGLDFRATPESAWAAHVGTPAPARITESALRTAIEWRTFGGPVPRVNVATPYGIRQQRWEATIKNFGLPVVAAEYADFLRELRAELERNKQNQGPQ